MTDNGGMDWDYILFGIESEKGTSKEKPKEPMRTQRVICPRCECSFPINGHCPDCGRSYGELYDA